MSSTRRHLDRRASSLLLLASLAGTGVAVVACSTSDTLLGHDEPTHADADATPPPAAEAGVDAPAPPFVGKPLPVVCASEPCAVSLVTTLAHDPDTRAEGYCALLSDKTVACWGANESGQLARGPSLVDSSTPERVAGLTDVVELDHTCAVRANGDVLCWGTGPFLQDPEDTAAVSTATTPVKLPLPPVAHVGIGHGVGCAALEDGRVLCWGSNEHGQLAPGWDAPLATSEPVARTIPNGAPIRRVLVGTATLLLREDGTLVSWGANPPIGRTSSLPIDPSPYPIAMTGVVGLDLAHDNACLAAGGRGYCWGAPVAPASSSALDRAMPEIVHTPEPVVDIATTRTFIEKGETIFFRWCAVAHDGDVYCRGSNDDGQIGDGTFADAVRPKQVAGLPAPAAHVKLTTSTTCALLTDGKVRCWGANSFGQLGNGQNRGGTATPVEVLLP